MCAWALAEWLTYGTRKESEREREGTHMHIKQNVGEVMECSTRLRAAFWINELTFGDIWNGQKCAFSSDILILAITTHCRRPCVFVWWMQMSNRDRERHSNPAPPNGYVVLPLYRHFICIIKSNSKNCSQLFLRIRFPNRIYSSYNSRDRIVLILTVCSTPKPTSESITIYHFFPSSWKIHCSSHEPCAANYDCFL